MSNIPPNAVFDPTRADPMREAARAGGERAVRPDFRHLAQPADPGLAAAQAIERARAAADRRGPAFSDDQVAAMHRAATSSTSDQVAELRRAVAELQARDADREERLVQADRRIKKLEARGAALKLENRRLREKSEPAPAEPLTVAQGGQS